MSEVTTAPTFPAGADKLWSPYCDNNILKITTFVLGLLSIGGAIAIHIFQVNAIAVYTMGGIGGFLILATLITAVIQHISRKPLAGGSLNSSSIEDTQEIQQVQLIEEKKKLLEDFTPAMVNALGGVDKLLTFPTIAWNGTINFKDLTAPVSRGYHNGCPFLLFCYAKQKEKKDPLVVTEFLCKTPEGWNGPHKVNYGELNLCSPNPIQDQTQLSLYLYDKICRLMEGRAVGLMKKYDNVNTKIKPDNRNLWRPKKSYLEGENLEKFMDLDTQSYETKPPKKGTNLFLYNPSLSPEENQALFNEKFPKKGKTKK